MGSKQQLEKIYVWPNDNEPTGEDSHPSYKCKVLPSVPLTTLGIRTMLQDNSN